MLRADRLRGKEHSLQCYRVDAWRQIPGPNGYRLLDDAEWEYACRAGTSTDFSSGNDRLLLFGYCKMYPSTVTALCGEKLPNAWGLHDVRGNVWEWCWDLSHESSNLRVRRSGAWSGGFYAELCRSAVRAALNPAHRSSDLSFRLALSPSGVSSPAEQGQGESEASGRAHLVRKWDI